MDSASTSNIPVPICHITWHHVPGDCSLEFISFFSYIEKTEATELRAPRHVGAYKWADKHHALQ
jgi:hypothetical protein